MVSLSSTPYRTPSTEWKTIINMSIKTCRKTLNERRLKCLPKWLLLLLLSFCCCVNVDNSTHCLCFRFFCFVDVDHFSAQPPHKRTPSHSRKFMRISIYSHIIQLHRCRQTTRQLIVSYYCIWLYLAWISVGACWSILCTAVDTAPAAYLCELGGPLRLFLSD